MLKRLQALGCRTAEMLEGTYAGNEAFYEQMLKRLGQSDCPARLAAAVAAGEASAVFAAAHELKGLYGTMGITPLYGECSELVEIVRAGSMEGVAGRVERLLAGHESIVEEIKAGGA